MSGREVLLGVQSVGLLPDARIEDLPDAMRDGVLAVRDGRSLLASRRITVELDAVRLIDPAIRQAGLTA